MANASQLNKEIQKENVIKGPKEREKKRSYQMEDEIIDLRKEKFSLYESSWCGNNRREKSKQKSVRERKSGAQKLLEWM